MCPKFANHFHLLLRVDTFFQQKSIKNKIKKENISLPSADTRNVFHLTLDN